MTAGRDHTRRLLRWYPASWRARYGEEFAELLAAEYAEQPRNWRRTANVIGSGLLARCGAAGLTGQERPAAEQIRAGLATLGAALAAFTVLGVAMLAQLATGWQWTVPKSASAAAGTLIMAAAAAALAVLATAAIVPLAGRTVAALARGRTRLARPAAVALASAVALAAGTRHFQNGWPGTGGTGAQHGLVPGGVAAFGWASTLSVSSFWVHPALLGRFPVIVLAWMALSPLAGAGLVAGLVVVVRRLPMSAHMLRYESALAIAAAAVAVVFMAGSAGWVGGHSAAESGLFRPGLVNGAELLTMMLALLVVLRAATAARRASRRLPATG
jgi:hypothetical protein